MSYVNQNKTQIIEGELRCKELNHYLESLKLQKYVWLSEDASGIVAKVEFDPKTNQMIGLVLPIDSKSGLPISFTYLARNAEEIYKNMKCNKSSYVYIVVAQPLAEHVPPFILQIFGTDSKFNTQQILLRWKTIVNELQR